MKADDSDGMFGGGPYLPKKPVSLGRVPVRVSDLTVDIRTQVEDA
jgi:hypothetical protein